MDRVPVVFSHPARLRVGSRGHVGSIEGGSRHDAQADVDSFGPWGPNPIEVHLRWAGRLAAVVDPDRLLGDKGYDSDAIRNDLGERGIEACASA